MGKEKSKALKRLFTEREEPIDLREFNVRDSSTYTMQELSEIAFTLRDRTREEAKDPNLVLAAFGRAALSVLKRGEPCTAEAIKAECANRFVKALAVDGLCTTCEAFAFMHAGECAKLIKTGH